MTDTNELIAAPRKTRPTLAEQIDKYLGTFIRGQNRNNVALNEASGVTGAVTFANGTLTFRDITSATLPASAP